MAVPNGEFVCLVNFNPSILVVSILVFLSWVVYPHTRFSFIQFVGNEIRHRLFLSQKPEVAGGVYKFVLLDDATDVRRTAIPELPRLESGLKHDCVVAVLLHAKDLLSREHVDPEITEITLLFLLVKYAVRVD